MNSVVKHLNMQEIQDMLLQSIAAMSEQRAADLLVQLLDEQANTTRPLTEMRGFEEFKHDEAGYEDAAVYMRKKVANGMSCIVGHNAAGISNPHDNWLVKWYNPSYFRSFAVRK